MAWGLKYLFCNVRMDCVDVVLGSDCRSSFDADATIIIVDVVATDRVAAAW